MTAPVGAATRGERRGTARLLPGTPGNDGFRDRSFGRLVFKLLPGDFAVTRRDEVLTTVLGSCIAACIRDPVAGVGGMNHFMLPSGGTIDSGAWAGRGSPANRYGAFAMESLINALLTLGAQRARLEVKLFGGAAVIPGMSDVGAKNIEFARAYLRTEGLGIVAESVGDRTPRRVNYFPRTGEVLLKRLRAVTGEPLAARERAYLDSLAGVPESGGVELFTD